MNRGAHGCWFVLDRERLRFEASARVKYPGLRGFRAGTEIRYRLCVLVPEYEPRLVEVRLARGLGPHLLGVSADGPDASPHRYKGGDLCMWDPRDALERRWVPKDGLCALLDLVRLHLFREAYWLETGEWLGPEAPHRESGEEAA